MGACFHIEGVVCDNCRASAYGISQEMLADFKKQLAAAPLNNGDIAVIEVARLSLRLDDIEKRLRALEQTGTPPNYVVLAADGHEVERPFAPHDERGTDDK